MGNLISVLLLLTLLGMVHGTALSDSAASMAPGTWKKINTGNFSSLYNVENGNIFNFANDAVWSDSSEKLMFWGSDHGRPYTVGILYDAKLNQWKSCPFYTKTSSMHAYELQTIDTKNNVAYYWFNDRAFHKFDVGSETWLPDTVGSSAGKTTITSATAYFPEMHSILYSNGGISRFNIATSTWGDLKSWKTGYYNSNLLEYNPVFHCVYNHSFHGGTENNVAWETLYAHKVDSTGHVTNLKPPPFTIGVNGSLFSCDPVSGIYLTLRADSLYGYDINDDVWFNLGTNPGPRMTVSVITQMKKYGVIAVISGGTFPNGLWLYKYSGVNDTTKVVNLKVNATSQTIEQYLSTRLSVVATYAGGAKDTSNTRCGFFSIDTDIVNVSRFGGVVTALNTGTGRVAVVKRGVYDTLLLTVVASTAELDSIQLSTQTMTLLAGENYQVNATGFFHKGAEVYKRLITSEAVWSSSSETVAMVAGGLVQAVGAGGPMNITASMNGKSKSVPFTVYPALSFVKRIKFQTNIVPWSFGWEVDNGQAYNAARAWGWTSGALDSRNDRNGNELFRAFVVTTSGRFRIDAPDGSYITKICMGDNLYGVGGTNNTLFGADTVAWKHIGLGNEVTVDTITVTGGYADLAVYGAINYLVMVSNQGVNINDVALDGGTPVPLYTSREVSPEPAQGQGLAVAPNPFNPTVSIQLPQWTRGKKGSMRLCLFSAQGLFLKDLTHEINANGQVWWNASKMASGIYFARLTVGGKSYNTRLTLLK